MSMTESEAIKALKNITEHTWVDDDDWVMDSAFAKAYGMAISALSEIQQYRAIGTVSEFRELKEKATVKKPIPLDKVGEYHECPTCGGYAENNCGSAYRFCPNCGTEFDWSEGKE